MRDQRGAFERPLVVQPRRQRFPLVDERSAGVHPGLPVPVAHRARVVAGCDHHVIDARCAARRRHGHARSRPVHELGRGVHGWVSRKPGGVRIRRGLPHTADPVRRNGGVDHPVPGLQPTTGPEVVCGPLAGHRHRHRRLGRGPVDQSRDPLGRRGERGAENPCGAYRLTEMDQRRPVTVDEQVVQRPLRLGHPAQGLGVAIGPAHPDAEDDLPDHDTHAVEPRRLELLGVVAVPAAHVVHLVPPLEPVRADDARCRRVGEPLRPRQRMVGQPLEREGRLALDRYSGTRRGQPVEQLGPTLLEGVEEDPVDLRARRPARPARSRRRGTAGCRCPTGCSRRTP